MKKCVKLYTDEVLYHYYEMLRTETDTEQLHLPHSDVFYVRENLRIKQGLPVGTYPYTLKQIEDAMLAEGWGVHESNETYEDFV